MKISFGKPFAIFPWVNVINHALMKPEVDVLVLSKLQSGRIRVASGMVLANKWLVNVSGVTQNNQSQVVAWHPNGVTVDIARTWKAIRWTEKHYGLMKVKNQQEWMEQLYKNWHEQPWA